MAYSKTRKTYKKKTATKKPLVKRGFYAKADLGIFGKYELGKRSLNSKILAVVNGEKECKRKLIDNAINTLQTGHYSRNILGNITQGTSTLTRESEEIYICGFKGSFTYTHVCTAAIQPSFVRTMLIRSKVEYYSASDAYSSSIGSADLYLNNATATNPVVSMIDPKKTQLLYDQVHTMIIQPGTNFNNYSKVVNFDIKLEHDYVYKTGSNYGNKYNYYWVHIPWARGGTPGTTPVVYIEETSQVIFKDK